MKKQTETRPALTGRTRPTLTGGKQFDGNTFCSITNMENANGNNNAITLNIYNTYKQSFNGNAIDALARIIEQQRQTIDALLNTNAKMISLIERLTK